ncbi:MAG: GrpB family protein [Myxococcaceae bacterium]
MTARRLIIDPYREQWPAEFARLRELLSTALGDVAVRIDHIGSTAVPGLAAKDIIDVQVGVADLADPRLAPAFERVGAVATEITSDHVPPGDPSGPAGWKKRYFRAPASWRPANLHVRQVGLPNFRYALLFRDYLRASAPAAAAYAQVKIALARLHPDDPEAYYEVKDPVCDLIMGAAEHWAAATRWSP